MRALASSLPLLLLSLARPAGALPERAIPVPDPGSLAERFRAPATADTCRAVWDTPLYYLWEFAQERCEATLCSTPFVEPITAVGVVWFNYGASSFEKPVRVFIADDAGGLPGEILWSIETTTGLLAEAETRLVTYPVDPPLVAWGPVWFGHEELAAGPPSSLFDGVRDGWSASSEPPCGAWVEQELADYLQLVAADDPTSGVATSQAPAFDLRVASPARGTLEMDISTAHEGWIAVTLHDAAGRLVRRITSGPGSGVRHLSLPVGGLSRGVYFVRAVGGAGERARRVVVLG